MKPGTRVQLHPGTDMWMRGARYGTVVKVGTRYLHVWVDRLERKIQIRTDLVMEVPLA